MIRDGPPKWLDGTPQLAATIFNNDKSVSTAAQSCRIIFDKHWHGGNRGKAFSDNAEARRVMMQCHMCGEIDSQEHCFQHCTHTNVASIRIKTLTTLETLAMQHTDTDSSLDNHELHARLIRAIIGMLETEECSGRIWTSNWNSAMIQNLSDILNLRKVSKKVLVSLRKTLLEMGGIFADGVREILDLRNTIHTASATAEQHLQDKIERGKLR
jgi:uncharacterized OB-fold protein